MDNSTPSERPKERKRVGFTPGGESVDFQNQRSTFDVFDKSQSPSQRAPHDGSWHGSPSHSRQGSGTSPFGPDPGPTSTSSFPKPRPAIRNGASSDRAPQDVIQLELDAVSRKLSNEPEAETKSRRAYEAAKRLEQDESTSAPGTARSSFDSPRPGPTSYVDGIPLMDLREDRQEKFRGKNTISEARKLVRTHTRMQQPFHDMELGSDSGYATPLGEPHMVDAYLPPRPKQYRGGILSSLMKLYNPQGQRGHDHSESATPMLGESPPSSGTSTPLKNLKHWYRDHTRADSRTSLVGKLVDGSASLGAPAQGDMGEQVAKRLKQRRPANDHQIKITIHISEVIQRQRYLLRLCRALMQFGAPTHRLEEYMKMSARVLEIEGQFLYIPGCMIISFDDPATHTTEVQLVRVTQAVDLGKLSDTHDIYKAVVHDQIDAKEGYDKINFVLKRPNKHKRWMLVPVYGCAAAAVGPFAFGARPIDLPIAFLLGCILGFLQLVVAPASETYSNVFEISAAVLTSFLARAFGSIKGGNLFCFSALAQSSIALILPGYIVLCASLELQSHAIVAGSVRMVYAIIYSLFLGFGITIGTAIYGVFDHNAASSPTCENPSSGYLVFLSVPCFTLCLCVINQAKWKQTPVMLVIAFVGYLINYFSSKRFPGNTQVSQTLAAFAIGLMANLYSRLVVPTRNISLDIWEHTLRPWLRKTWDKKDTIKNKISKNGSNEPKDPVEETSHARAFGFGLAAASMLPAIFVQVPSGLSVEGSLVSGVASANQITGQVNSTQSGTTVVSSPLDNSALNSSVFVVGYSVIQIAIGITCGLFFSALVVYPFGKKRSALFSF